MLEVLKSRNVQHLVHFTRVGNLPSILQRGLVSRSQLEQNSVAHATNDTNRYDYLPSGICLSVTFPNYRMFYRYRINSETDWVVVRLKPELIVKKKCAFCFKNAAAHEIARLGIEERNSLSALSAMFKDHEGMPSRSSVGVPDAFTTDPQAEIVVLEAIEPSYIIDVAVDKNDRLKDRAALLALAAEWKGRVPFFQNRWYFDARFDREHWRSR